jgi:cytochrome c peroxidase
MRRTISRLLLLSILTLPLLALAQDLTPLEELGKHLFFDTNLSTPPGQSCATCHAPEVGFTGPDSEINATTAAYPGVVQTRFGNRKPPTAAYGGDSPVMYYDEAEGLFIGGMFWDGRATGWTLGDPLAEQALGPFLNPLEMNNPNAKIVCIKVAGSDYADLFEEVWGPGSLDFVRDVAGTYERIGRAIAAYERSAEVNPFTSKYDYYLAGMAELTEEEALGLEVFNNQGLCNLCHLSEPGPSGEPPLFTDFTYDNLGIPRNEDMPFYQAVRKYNIEGFEWRDLGLGGFLEGVPEYADLAPENYGKHKVPTLRNVDKRPYEGFVKDFGHNGFFKSLEEIVHFYNTRDVEDWPEPEVPENVNTDELGNLGLSPVEEAALVAFLRTLSDGYVPPAPAAGAAGGVSLRAATPNPFNPLSALEFNLPRGGDIQLDVFNLRGQRVQTLARGWYPAGMHRIDFGDRELASGVYLGRLVANGRIATAKFSLVK